MIDDSLSVSEATEVLQKMFSEAGMLDENGNFKKEYAEIIDRLNSIPLIHAIPISDMEVALKLTNPGKDEN